MLLSALMYLLSDSEEFDVCAAGHTPDSIMKNVLLPAINTLLKNYAALTNEELSKKKSNGTKRKLVTLK